MTRRGGFQLGFGEWRHCNIDLLIHLLGCTQAFLKNRRLFQKLPSSWEEGESIRNLVAGVLGIKVAEVPNRA